jgi:hypothetical protein
MKINMDKSAEVEKKLAEARSKIEEELGVKNDIKETAGGWELLLNENVLILCVGYFYIGKLTGVNDEFVELTDAYVLYYAEDFSPAKWKKENMDKLPGKVWNVQLESVESFGAAK